MEVSSTNKALNKVSWCGRNIQISQSKKQEQHHWVMHWNQTKHSALSLFQVSKGEKELWLYCDCIASVFKSTDNEIEETGFKTFSEGLKTNNSLCSLKFHRKQGWYTNVFNISTHLLSCSINRVQDRRNWCCISWSNITSKHKTLRTCS